MDQSRSCGTCGLCCKVFEIDVLAKAAGVWCRHRDAAAGCSIHGAHPPVCRAFQCAWIADAALDEAWKPERCGFVMHAVADGYRLWVNVDPQRPDAWRASPYYETLKAWSAGALDDTRSVVVNVGPDVIALFPEEDLVIAGGREEGEAVSTGYFRDGPVRRPYVAVRRTGGMRTVRGQAWRG
jgi:Fe-S-cluster containining protein